MVFLNLIFFFQGNLGQPFCFEFLKWNPLKTTTKFVFIPACKHFSFQWYSIPFLLHDCISREMLKNHESCDTAFFLNNSFWNIFRKIDCLLMKFTQAEEYHKIIFFIKKMLKIWKYSVFIFLYQFKVKTFFKKLKLKIEELSIHFCLKRGLRLLSRSCFQRDSFGKSFLS